MGRVLPHKSRKHLDLNFVFQLLRDSERELAFRMQTLQYHVDDSEYTVHVDDSTTRYASKEGGIVVEVKGHYVTVQNAVDVSRAKRRRRYE